MQDGLLAAPSELYYPIRLKPRGLNSLLTLAERGIDHIEIRCVDLNPLTGGLVDVRDVEFVHTLLAHIRLATVGHIEYENCHPFTAADNCGRTWTLVHNGTIFNGTLLNDYVGILYGDTDSERVLLHLVERINHAQNHLHRALNEKERFDVLFTEIAVLAKRNKLNLLIFDGEVLYAHCNFRDTLHVCQEEDAVTFSTRALSAGRWAPVPFTSLIAAKDGEIVRTSPPHGNEYIYNPDDYRLVYMDFARL